MACGGCSKHHTYVRNKNSNDPLSDLTGGYANLNNQQIKARLEAYKRKFCTNCAERYTCDFGRFLECKKLK